MVQSPPQSLWLWMLVALVQFFAALQTCIFDEVQSQVRPVRPPPQNPAGGKHRVRREEGLDPQPIRIRSWIPRESKNLSEEEKEKLEAAVKEAVGTVSSLLSVNREPGRLLLSRDVNKYCKFIWRNSSTANYNRCGRANKNYRCETCMDVTIPDEHLAGCDVYPEADSPRRTELRPEGAGLPDTDFLLYLHVQSTDKCRAETSVLAYAVHCQVDTKGRPVAGVVVVCRDRLTAYKHNHRATVQTLIHELFHALGFSKQLFHTWRDCSSTSAAGCSPRSRVTHSDDLGQLRIYTPSVTSALQQHLASTDPELGGPLENLDGPAGGASSHWEARVLRGSIMSAVLGDSATVRIDPVTLAALQDTGWYSVNVSRAQSLIWGEGEGATFGSPSTCQDKASSFFCTGSGFGCHYLHLHKGACQTNPYLEGCRAYEPLKNGSECWKVENGGKSIEQTWSGEIFGFDSRCFFSNLTRQDHSELLSSNSSVVGRCYRHRCTGPNRFQVQVSGSDWTDCPAGGATRVRGYQGLVSCPDRRLCLYSDVSPPSDDVTTFSASVQSDPSEMLTLLLRPQTELIALSATTLTVTAAACLLAAVAASCRKCCSGMVRIQPAPDHPSDPRTSTVLALNFQG